MQPVLSRLMEILPCLIEFCQESDLDATPLSNDCILLRTALEKDRV